MQTQPVTKEVQTPVDNQAYENVGRRNQRTSRKKAETVKPTEAQQDALTLAVVKAQNETRAAKAAIVREASDTLATEILNDISATTSMALVTKLADTLNGEHGAGTVLRGFLSTTITSTYQPLDEIERLEQTQPILLEMFQEQKLLTA